MKDKGRNYPRGLFLKDMGGGGACVFRCRAEAVKGTLVDHKKCRTKCIEYLRTRPRLFAGLLHGDYLKQKEGNCKSFEEYLRALQNWTAWGGWLQRFALCLLTNRQLHVCTSMGIPPLVLNRDGAYIVRMFHDEAHCQLLVGDLQDNLTTITNVKLVHRSGFGAACPSSPWTVQPG